MVGSAPIERFIIVGKSKIYRQKKSYQPKLLQSNTRTLLTVSMSGSLPAELIIEQPIPTAQKWSVRTLFATAQEPHSRDIFIKVILNKKV